MNFCATQLLDDKYVFVSECYLTRIMLSYLYYIDVPFYIYLDFTYT